jgi:glycosyltransferase involved in cell wall biosynthesis
MTADRESSRNGNAAPRVSVVMPVRNEADWIDRSLGAVLGQEYPAEQLEVIVVVGRSTDDTRDRVAQIAAADPRVRLLENPDGRTPVSLNLGIRASDGDVVVRVDGHAIISPDFVREAVAALDRTAADGVGGHAQHVGVGAMGEAIAAAMTSRVGAGNASFRVGGTEREADTIVFGAYRRGVFDRVGFMDESLTRNQDDEFNHRVRLHGGRLVFVPSVRSSYVVRSSLSALWRQYADYGRYRVSTLWKHHRPGAVRQLAPPALVLLLVGGGLAEALSGGRLRTARSVGGAYVAALLISGTAVGVRRGKPASGPLVAAALATMHLGYGVGFWTELARRVVDRRPE